MSKHCLGCMESIRDQDLICPHCGYETGTPAKNPTHLKPGTMLHDRYIVGRELGSGGFGVTYIGWDGKLQQKVAIKEYLPSEFSTRVPGVSQITVFGGNKSQQYHDGLKQFVEEAKRLAKFNSEPGIVKVFDSFEENDTAYIIMEYLDGETLSQYLAHEHVLPEDLAVDLLRPVMKSLQVIHKAGIIHRDIAPDNIFLTKTGEVKLIDFGAARYATTSHSRSLTVIVKPGYSPEEQYRSRGDQGPHTDVYALGATLYKMITGKKPPDALERRGKYERANQDILVPPHKLQKKISLSREVAILNAMNVRIEDRTPDVGTFMKELDADPPARRIHGKIKKLTFFAMPLWAKISVPTVLAAIVVLSTLMLTGVIDFSNFKKDIVIPEGFVVVPDVEGYLKEEALDKILGAQLQVNTAGSVESAYVPAGKIVLQNPIGGSYEEINGVVQLQISSGGKVEAAQDGKSKVPHVVWDSLEDAKAKLKAAGLGEPTVKEAADEVVAAGHVISQSVQADTELEEGSVIELVVSTGPKAVPMKQVTGMNIQEAEKLLVDLGLVVHKEYEKNDSVAENHVIRQSIPADQEIKRGTEVTLSVSSGRKTVSVPSVIGMSKQDAKWALEQQGFSVSILENHDEYTSAGNVFRQSPDAGSNQNPGAEIVIYVSKGPRPRGVDVANVVGMTAKKAKSTLSDQGFSVVVQENYHDYAAKGVVYAQTPDAGVSKMPGAEVVIYVSLGPEIRSVDIANVIGLRANEAKSKLSDQGFSVVVQEEYHNQVAKGVVYAQSPDAGVSKMPGSEVVIYVSKGKQPISVSFDGNGGSVHSDGMTVYLGEPYGDLPSASRNGYAFTGWYLGDTKITSSTKVTTDSDHVLRAGWSNNAYTLTFDTNGGDTANSSVNIPYGSPYGKLPTPKRQHYTFDGWFTAASGGTQVSADTKMGTSDVTVYAHWSMVPYSVTWQDGTGYTVSVVRTASPRAGASTGAISSGTTVYYGDELQITYAAQGYYQITSKGAEHITVSGNVDGSQIYASASVQSATYQILYRSTNGTDLGSDTVSHECGSSYTVTPPDRSGYYTPEAQNVSWDTPSSKDIVFTYEPVPVSTADQSGTLSDWVSSGHQYPTIYYNTSFAYRNRTADSVEVQLTISETIKYSFFTHHIRRIRTSTGGTPIDDIALTYYGEWGEQVGYDRTKQESTAWVRIPVNTTDATSVTIDAYFYEANKNGTDLSGRDDACPSVSLSWSMNIPAY